jgi:DNA-binding NarL/FixJ family response regulator
VRKILHIIIAEPSSIVFEGLDSIFNKSALKPVVSRADTFELIHFLHQKRKADIVIINPSFIQNNLKSFNLLKNQLESVQWVALVYAFFDQHLLSSFENSISISDAPDTIIDTINRIKSAENPKEQLIYNEIISEREIDVLKLLASGMSNKEIAEKLNISINTVITHRKNISQKTGIKSVSGLTIYAVLKKFVTLDDFSE